MRYSQETLKSIALTCAEKITNAKSDGTFDDIPFQHLVIDNFLPTDVANALLEGFPKADDPSWERTNDVGVEVKSRSNWKSEFDIPEALIDILRVFNSAPILKAMSDILSIPKLMSDPYYAGGGLNMSETHGLLDVHVDGNYHDASGMNRRVNLLYYLNPNWRSEWGGEFGIYDSDGERLVKSVEPVMNRCVIFDTHDKSFHGLPNPINFPSNDPRRSILLYYYTVEKRPATQIAVDSPHSALWRSKGYNDKRGNKTREFE